MDQETTKTIIELDGMEITVLAEALKVYTAHMKRESLTTKNQGRKAFYAQALPYLGGLKQKLTGALEES